MSELVSEKLLRLTAYDPDISECAIHLDANESFIPLPQALREKIADKIKAIAFNRYPDPLSVSVCGAFGAYYGVPAANVTAGNGSDELITIILNTLMKKGDRVLITQPDFSMYRLYCELAEVEPVVLQKNDALCFNPDNMIALAKEKKVRLILFSNPCNPTSQGIEAAEVLKIIRSVDCLVVVDEAYMDFWNEPIVQKAVEFENLIVLKTCSKVGFAAARLGFAVANDVLTGYLRAAKSPYNVNALTQAAGEVMLRDADFLPNAVKEIVRSRDGLYQSLKELEGCELRVYKPHANFVTVSSDSAAAIHKKLKAAGISVRLIAGRYLRITAGTPRENSAFLREFERIYRA